MFVIEAEVAGWKHSFVRGQEPKVFLRQGSFFPSHVLRRCTAFPAPGLSCPSQNPLRWRIQPDIGFLGSPISSDFPRLCPMWMILLGFLGLSDQCPWPPTSSDCVRCGDSLIRFSASDGPPPFRSYIMLYVNGDGVVRWGHPHCTGAPVPSGPTGRAPETHYFFG